MPSEVFEDGENLQIGLLEAEFLRSDGRPAHAASMPFPRLKPLGQSEMRTFRTLILENQYLRVTIFPGLGGRILSLFDKRTQTEILRRHAELTPIIGGLRGVTLREGIQFRLNHEDRVNSLGNVDSQLDFPLDEESAAGVWLAESSVNLGFGFHLHLSLPADRAALQIEIRVHNRLLEPLPYAPELSIYVGGGSSEVPGVWFDAERQVGLFAIGHPEPIRHSILAEGHWRLQRFAESQSMGGRVLDAFTWTLVPISGLPSVSGATLEGAIRLEPNRLVVQATRASLEAKVVNRTRDGQTLEAPIDLYPERLLDLPLEFGSDAVEAVILDANKVELLRSAFEAPRALDPKFETFGPTPRAVGHTRRAEAALRHKAFGTANQELEQALLYNGEDHLAWWAKAMALRLMGDAEGERPELLNAHFLAPLDPVLRAESFLSTSPSMGKEPSAIVAALLECPENLIEVACQLLEWGLYDQAQRWIDEALRHRDLAMLRYLLAFAYLSASRMTVEAAEQVRAAGTLGDGPPYPWRAIERTALLLLANQFPDDVGVRRMLGIVSLNEHE